MRATRSWMLLCLASLLALALPAAATQPGGSYTVSTAGAVPPAPGRAGRLAEFSGSVWIYEQDRGEWIEGLRNMPLTTGDRVSTGNDARAEMRIGSTTLRMNGRSELEIVQLDDQRLRLQLHAGSAAVRVRTREWAEQIDIATPEVRLRPMQAGHYRIDRLDDVSFAGTWHGELLVDEASAFPIGAGQRMEFWRERGGVLRHRWASLPADGLQAWAVGEDQREERTAYSRHVSPEMTGAEDLDRHGRWEQLPEYGAVWFPITVQIGWAPYQLGRWVWVSHWGWVWVDNQPWGFAPFHYGRWVQWRGRWGWVPGHYTPRPSFRPAPRPPHAGQPHPPPPNVGRPRPPGQPPVSRPPHQQPPHAAPRPPHATPQPPYGPRPPSSQPDPRPRPPVATPPHERPEHPRQPVRPPRAGPDRGAPTPQPVTSPPPAAAPVGPGVATAPPAAARPPAASPPTAVVPPPAAAPPALRLPPRGEGEARPEKPADRGERRDAGRDKGRDEAREEARKRAPERPGQPERGQQQR